MYDNYAYPIGADTPTAPWNLTEPPEKTFNVLCSQTLSKTAPITTNNYQLNPYEETEEQIDADNTNWQTIYNDEVLTPLQIIEQCNKICQALIASGIKEINHIKLKPLITDCLGWQEDELEIIKC